MPDLARAAAGAVIRLARSLCRACDGSSTLAGSHHAPFRCKQCPLHAVDQVADDLAFEDAAREATARYYGYDRK